MSLLSRLMPRLIGWKTAIIRPSTSHSSTSILIRQPSIQRPVLSNVRNNTLIVVVGLKKKTRIKEMHRWLFFVVLVDVLLLSRPVVYGRIKLMD